MLDIKKDNLRLLSRHFDAYYRVCEVAHIISGKAGTISNRLRSRVTGYVVNRERELLDNVNVLQACPSNSCDVCVVEYRT